MKVTAIIPDKLIQDVKTLTKGKNITESLTIALKEWISIQKINNLNKEVYLKPLFFSENYSADKVRNLNRK
jgi:hypothetical protein